MLAERFGLKLSPGLTDYLTGNTAPQDILQSVEVIAGESGVGRGIAGAGNGNLPATGSERLVCITSGQTAPRPTELLASDRFQAFLAEVSRVYESVILDSAPLLPVADSLEIVPYVDGVLICVRLEQTTRAQARAANTALERMPPRSTAVVVTAIDERDEGYYGYYGYYGASTPTASGAAR
jgi:Mrp family chromosome partitioning ATPase